MRAALSVLLLPAIAAADIDLQFQDVDLDRSGYVTPREFAASGLFQAQDFDDNGVLSPGEFEHETLFTLWDEDDDRDLEPAEFYSGMLGTADVNGDGKLGSLEFQRALVEFSDGSLTERFAW